MTTTKTDRQPAWVLEARRIRDEHSASYQAAQGQRSEEARGKYIGDLLANVKRLTGLDGSDLELIHGGGFYHDVMIRADGYHFVKSGPGVAVLEVVEFCPACERWNRRGTIPLRQQANTGEQWITEHEGELEDFARIIDSPAPDHECGRCEGDKNYAIPLPVARELPRRIRPHELALLEALETFVIRSAPDSSII